MSDLLTYYDIKYASTSKIFEAEEIKDLTPDQLQEAEKFYYAIVEKLEKKEPIEEGLLGGLLGGSVGFLVGPAIGKAICKALSIDEKGTLGTLLCSRLVSTAIGAALGYNK